MAEAVWIRTKKGAAVTGDLDQEGVKRLASPLKARANEFGPGESLELDMSKVGRFSVQARILFMELAMKALQIGFALVIVRASDEVKESLHEIQNWDKLFQFR